MEKNNMKFIQGIFIAPLLIALTVTSTFAASFDCAKASTNTEKMICSNLEISQADERLAKAYKNALSGGDKAALKEEQKKWLKSRNTISDVSLLLKSYNDRIEALESVQKGKAVASDKFSDFSIDGKYIFNQPGCSGNMEVKEVSGAKPHIIAEINTICGEQYHTCDFKAKGERVISKNNLITANFVVDEEGDDIGEFETEFYKNGITINVQKRGGYCGMNAYYDGKWIKDSGDNRGALKKLNAQDAQRRSDAVKMIEAETKRALAGIAEECRLKSHVMRLRKICEKDEAMLSGECAKEMQKEPESGRDWYFRLMRIAQGSEKELAIYDAKLKTMKPGSSEMILFVKSRYLGWIDEILKQLYISCGKKY